ncbi:MAG: NrfD/PsrC family molybdoenzyme membrane anchor subunit [Hyphomicrobiales bacterium]
MARIVYQELKKPEPIFYALVTLHVVVIAVGLLAALYMEHSGHVVTGMNNQIVWGLPHVFAVFLIVAASGALNVASISSVFQKLDYKPFARLSGLLAVSLLVGGLSVLVLDLGRPERLIVAMTTYNFKSIFAWNIYLYTGFVGIVAAYLWTMMDRTATRFNKPVAFLAFMWRLILTTGTGSIFGFLMAREAYDAAIMAPLFIAASFAYGLAFTILALITMCRSMNAMLMTDEVVYKFRGLMIIFILAVLYFTTVMHITNMYATEHHGVERFLLLDGGAYTAIFWLGQVVIGSLVPLGILGYGPVGKTRWGLTIASLLVLVGGLAQMYVIIVAGQAYPLDLFPGMDVTSTFGDGQVAHYLPTLPELLLGIAGISIAMLLAGVAILFLRFLPDPKTVVPNA